MRCGVPSAAVSRLPSDSAIVASGIYRTCGHTCILFEEVPGGSSSRGAGEHGATTSVKLDDGEVTGDLDGRV